MIGKTISHYQITQKLGEGGMGVVYRAHDENLDRDVAIKVLPEEVAQNAERLTRFEREAKTVAALNHPNIVTIYSVEKDNGVHFITMELVEGQALSELMTPSGLPLDRLFDLAIPLADAVNSAHSKGVAHRDLKPANIMIDEEGRLKVLDFGLAKLFDPKIGPSIPADGATIDLASSPTAEGKILGTPDYMSPEQAEGKSVDHRSDIFSLGIILYEMIAGQRPFRGESPAGTISSILRDTPVSVSDLRAELPHHLGRIIGRCLSKPPDRRYQSALDLRNDLAELKKETESSQQVEVSDKVVGVGESGWRSKRLRAVGFTIIAVAAVAIGVWQLRPDAGTPGAGDNSARKMLVVLPFENLGSPADEYFADGMTEEITARLAGIHGLGVIARTSAVQYRDTDKTVQQIGQELGVEYILEGTVRWQGISEGRSRVRVTPQLIKVSDATHLWADVYQKDMTDIFQVQSDIALRVAEALDVALLEPERRSLEVRPTENLLAYEAYLRGLAYSRRPDYSKEDLELAAQMFDRAVKLDPTFAVAYAELSKAHSILYHLGYDATAERQAGAKVAVDLALELQPDLPEAHLALGYYYYWARREYDRALEALAIAERGLPNDGRLLEAVAFIWRRQGRFEASLDKMKRALELSPRDAQLSLNIAFTNLILRRYAEAEGYYDRSISLAPDQKMAYVRKARNLVLWRGDIQGARTTLERMTKKSHPFSIIALHELELYEGEYRGALNRLASISVESVERPGWYRSKAQLAGLVYRLMEKPDQARSSFDSARVLLEEELEGRPDDHRIHTSLGIVYAGLGRKDDAIREGKLGVELLPISKDAVAGASLMTDLALIHVMVGEYDLAMEQIEYLLSIPCQLSVTVLRLDPRWNPLREFPRFQRLLEEGVEVSP